MKQISRSGLLASESSLLTDALVRVEIAYLDSDTNFKELLSAPFETEDTKSKSLSRRMTISGEKLGWISLTVLVIIALIVWFFGQ